MPITSLVCAEHVPVLLQSWPDFSPKDLTIMSDHVPTFVAEATTMPIQSLAPLKFPP
jgi:hypothetical protein